jgi:hypothetical protein
MSHEGDALREQLNLLHKCLLSTGGGAMREQLAACLLPRVALSFRARLPGVGAEILSDATSDAILRYLQRPSIYLTCWGSSDQRLLGNDARRVSC